jgi:hypothetical protein
MRYAVLLALVVACGDKKPAAQPRLELLETITVLAGRVCECGTDKECIRAIREEWDAQKADIMNHGLTGDEKATFDAELLRMRACGDAGGLTFWMPPPRE